MSGQRLFGEAGGPIPRRMMTRLALFASVALAALPASAAAPKKPAHPAEKPAAGPKAIGTFDDWTAATHQEGGVLVCYAFTRAQSSSPALPGRGPVILTVTQRPSGRDAVAMEAGFNYPANASVTVQVDQAGLEFYTDKRNAFARDGKAAVAALGKGSRAIARSPGPKEATVTDTFSLKGFAPAYAAIAKACPAK
jgi:Invasion associated locus B (IalB) protein